MKKDTKLPQSLQNVNFMQTSIDVEKIPLTSGIACQRPVDQKRIAEICAQWNSGLADPLRVNIKDGVYRLVDGQHTCAAYRNRLHEGKEESPFFPCIYAIGLTEAQEADWLLFENSKHKDQPLKNVVEASIDAGNPELIERIRVLAIFGFSINHSNANGINVNCTSTLMNIPVSILASTFYVIKFSCVEQKEAVQARFIKGLSTFIAKYLPHDPDCKKLDRLADKIQKYTLSRILFEADARGGVPRDKQIPLVLVDVYNKNLPMAKRLDPMELLS